MPGDIDGVNAVKLALNQNTPMPAFTDPHVPGSALKLWFRELPTPVIAPEFYETCISMSDNSAGAIAVVDQLPALNRNILMFIVNFLQVKQRIPLTLTVKIIGRPENHKITKMNYDNLAMVWAPNFLRCHSEDPTVIFNNTRKEMAFVRQLLLHWDTSAATRL